jgi:hypothetical protein
MSRILLEPCPWKKKSSRRIHLSEGDDYIIK